MNADAPAHTTYHDRFCRSRSDAGADQVAEAAGDAEVCVLVQEVDQHWQTFTAAELDDSFPGWRVIAFDQDASLESMAHLIDAVNGGAGDAGGSDGWTDVRFHLVGASPPRAADPDRTESSEGPQRYARAMASLVLAELPVSLAEEWLDGASELTDRIRELAGGVCESYRLGGADLVPAVVRAVVGHLGTYFPGIDPPPPVASLPKQPSCDRASAWLVNNVAEAFDEFQHGLVALLARAAADFTVDASAPAL